MVIATFVCVCGRFYSQLNNDRFFVEIVAFIIIMFF